MLNFKQRQQMKAIEARKILKQNDKIKKTSKKFGVRLFNFGITAYRSIKTGRFICPFANECKKYCYAQKGAYGWSNTQLAYEKRYELTLLPNFSDIMIEAIKAVKADFIRVHDSGDFYSKEYRDKWFNIARSLPGVKFYAYTKSLDLFRNIEIPENFDLIFSIGGKLDKTIDKDKERHALIFDSIEDIDSSGYTNASEYDLIATKWFSDSNKIGLKFH